MPRNMLVILTDDQRFDTLWAMPLLAARCAERGVLFAEATVSTPICCPSRVSLLSGGYYVHTTGVLTNSLPYGGATLFDDVDSLPVRLQAAGYQTAMIGKYLNGYNSMAPRIPPGWSRFLTKYRGDWNAFDTVQGFSTEEPGVGYFLKPVSQYMTDYLCEEACGFLHSVGDAPFFLLLAPSAPHEPATPAPQDAEVFANYTYRGRGYGQSDLEGKPAHMQRQGMGDPTINDAFHRNQLRSLQAVDRAVVRILDTIDALGKRDDTVVVFTSDNGYQWGEHGLIHKGAPYEESLRVPMVVFAPDISPRTDRNLVVGNLDIPATALAMANLSSWGDGYNLLPVLADRELRIRPRGTFHEAFRQGGIPTTWAGWRTREWKYVLHATGEEELYDLACDPYELINVVGQPLYAERQERMQKRTKHFQWLGLGAQSDDGEGKEDDE